MYGLFKQINYFYWLGPLIPLNGEVSDVNDWSQMCESTYRPPSLLFDTKIKKNAGFPLFLYHTDRRNNRMKYFVDNKKSFKQSNNYFHKNEAKQDKLD